MFKKRFWTTKNIIFAGLVVLILLILPKIIGVLLLFFGAYVIACAMNPYVTKLMTKMNRTAASSIVVFGSIAGVIALFVPIIFVAYKEIKTFMMSLPEKVTELSDFLMNTQIYGHKIIEMVDTNSLMGNSTSMAKGIVDQSWNFTVAAFQLVMISVALTMIVYYILVDKAYLKSKFLEFFPPDLKPKAEGILSSISNRVGGYVRAQILSMVAVGVMMTIVLVCLRVEYSTLLGLITGIMDIIPLLGPTIALGVILLVAYPFSLIKLIIIVFGFLAVQQISNYVVRPVLFGKLMDLHPLMIFLALFLADKFLGFWGVILSPAIAATICVLIDELYLKPMEAKDLEEEGQ